MNADMHHQIKDALADIIATTPATPLTPRAAVHDRGPIDVDRQHGSIIRPRRLSIAVSFIAVTGLVGVGIAVLQQTQRSTVGPTGAITDAAPITGHWTAVADPGSVFVASDHVDTVTDARSTYSNGSTVEVSQIVPTDSGFLAVGTTNVGFRRSGSVWMSTDGLTWTSVADPSAFEAPADPAAKDGYGVQLAGVAVADGRYVAVGSTVADGAPTPAAWSSDDGSTWTRSPLADEPPPADSRGERPWPTTVGVIHTGNGFLAYGSDGADSLKGIDNATIAWSSTDGRTWQSDPLTGLIARGAHVVGITQLADRLLAYGSIGSYFTGQAQFWQSRDDGATWTRIDTPNPSSLAVTDVRAVVPVADGYLAIGAATTAQPSLQSPPGPDVVITGDQDVVAWHSPDGQNWSVLDTTMLNTPDFEQFGAATAGSAGVLIAYDRIGHAPSETMFVSTVDGQHFDHVTTDGVERVDILHAIPGGYLAAGADWPVENGSTFPGNSSSSTRLWFLAI